MDKLYTTKEIAEKYRVSPYMITHTWIKNGLKHIKGGRNSFLYKLAWVEEYLDNNIIELTSNLEDVKIKRVVSNRKKKCTTMVV